MELILDCARSKARKRRLFPMIRTVVRIFLLLIIVILLGSAGLRAEWIKDGVALCSAPSDQWYACIASDGAGGSIIAWYEVRSGVAYDFDIYAQRVDRDGNILWALDGVPICTVSGAQGDPQIAADGDGGAVIAWRDERSGTFDIYVQRIDANGVVQWTSDGVSVVAEGYGQYMPSVVPDGNGNFIIAWRDDRSGVGQIYCQKLDGNGNPQWTINGIAVCPTAWWQNIPLAVSDGSSGAIIVWEDERNSILNSYVYAQRIDGNGNKLWATSGVPITLSSGPKWQLCSIEDACGGAFVSWSSGDDGYRNIFAQRIDSTSAVWAIGDLPVCTASQDQDSPRIVLDGSGGAIIAWYDRRDSTDDVYAQRVTGDGDTLWVSNGIPIRINPPAGTRAYSRPELVQDGEGGAIIAWKWGQETSSYDIFAQRVDPDGNLLWPDTAVVVCGAVGGQYYPQMTSNAEGGAIITWRDLRQDTIGAVYAMRVTANGETVATLLQGFAARAQGTSIVIEWRLAEMDIGARFIVLRAMNGAPYEELGAADIRREGLLFTFVDQTCRPGVTYRYRVDVENAGERRILFESEAVSLPALDLSLAQNYPNPFNPVTTIRFDLPEKTRVRVAVYDCSGREIVRLVDGTREAGMHEVAWEGQDDTGNMAGSGVYFYRLVAGKETLTKKMVLLR